MVVLKTDLKSSITIKNTWKIVKNLGDLKIMISKYQCF